MSRNEWAYGTIELPRTEFASFRKGIADSVTHHNEMLYKKAQEFWANRTRKEKTDVTAFKAAADKANLDYELQWKMLQHGEPRRLTRADFEWPTARSTSFREAELALTFNPALRTVTYEVSENNHAREYAAETSLGKTFERLIRLVRWTRGTGGVILGNDEYSAEGGYYSQGGGGSYVVAAYGPKGAQEAPTHVDSFLNSQGKRVYVDFTVTRTGIKSKITATKPSRLQGYTTVGALRYG